MDDKKPPVLRVEDITKQFSGVRALDGVTLDIRAGEVLALMGENGAGKSTLLKILTGDHTPTAGRLRIDDAEVTFGSPRDAHRSGVRVIAQEPEIVPHVSVAENVYLGELPRRGRWFDRAALMKRVRADLADHGFADVLDPELLGGRLSAAQRQLVEILRALTSDVKVLAFDEPTSSLSDQEVVALFALIRRLRDRGVAIVYVSHRMPEILQLCDRIAVLRDGRLVGIRPAAETGEAELVRMMVGRDLSALFRRERRAAGAPVLELRDVSTDDVHDISFEVRAGEVVGLAGLVGAGRSELARAVVGDLPIRSGQVVLDGAPLRLRTPRDAVRAGIGFAPEERKAQALLLHRTIRDNVSIAALATLRRFRVVLGRKEREMVRTYAQRLRIKAPSIETEVRRLSGGNQQKVVLARWLARRPKMLILDEPTRGVDVGAKAEIYQIIDQLAADGIAVLVISSELPEVIGLADRVVVMQAGRVTGELSHEQADEESILALAMADHISRPAQNRIEPQGAAQ